MRLSHLLLSLVMLMGVSAHAGEAEIRKAITGKFPGANITSITKTPYGGLYEVVIDNEVIYASADGKYLVMGNVIELDTRRNITAARMAKLSEVKWHTLPLDKAIVEVKGDGRRKLAVFSDADCPFCRKLEPEIDKLNNVTVYTFLYPIEGLHPQAIPTSKQIWCEKDRLKAWKAYMLKGEKPAAKGDCPNPVDEVIRLGNTLRVTGTPTLIFENGQRVPGYVPADKLEQLLAAASRK